MGNPNDSAELELEAESLRDLREYLCATAEQLLAQLEEWPAVLLDQSAAHGSGPYPVIWAEYTWWFLPKLKTCLELQERVEPGSTAAMKELQLVKTAFQEPGGYQWRPSAGNLKRDLRSIRQWLSPPGAQAPPGPAKVSPKKQRAMARSRFLDAELGAKVPPSSDGDLARDSELAFKTVKSYRRGDVTRRTLYVRAKIAKALSRDLSAVPE